MQSFHDDLASADGSVIGVSLGRTQTYLASPSVTDAEKKAILEEAVSTDELADAEVSYQSHEATTISQLQQSRKTHVSTPHVDTSDRPPSAGSPTCTLPSPWRIQSKQEWTVQGEDGSKYASVMHRLTRPRASTSPNPPDITALKLKRYIPSLPKMPPLPRSLIPNTVRSISPSRLVAKADSKKQLKSSSDIEVGATESVASNESQSSVVQSLESVPAVRPGMLRRATSEGSLRLHHTVSHASHASSLGDDNRFTDVQKQVNSRMKAIKDSMADSSIRVPHLPDLTTMLNATRDIASDSTSKSRTTKTRQPYRHADSTSSEDQTRHASPEAHIPSMPKLPQFTKALEELHGDVVILGGYRGSVLRSALPPNRQLWVPIKVGLGLRKVDLEVGLEPEDEERVTETVIPSGMLKNIGPVEISKNLFQRLRTCRNALNGSLRVWDFGYDWRLSPQLLSAQLLQYLKKLPCNSGSEPRGATVIAHSLGGLLTRHVINQDPQLVRGVVYAGVPTTCVNILGPLRSGDHVLLNSKVLTAQVNFTFRSSYLLLPLNGACYFNDLTGERYDLDFFEPATWLDNCLSPVLARPTAPQIVPTPSSSAGFVGSVASMLPSFVRPRNANSESDSESSAKVSATVHAVSPSNVEGLQSSTAAAPQMTTRIAPDSGTDPNAEKDPSTAVTIPKHIAYAYLSRILPEIKAFKLALSHIPGHKYPPTALIYGKAVPTVSGAKVRSREAIRHADAHERLAFGSGDGVVLARAAQIPDGYRVVKGGIVSSERGHVSLLGDLEAVGKCLLAIEADRQRTKRPTKVDDQ